MDNLQYQEDISLTILMKNIQDKLHILHHKFDVK